MAEVIFVSHSIPIIWKICEINIITIFATIERTAARAVLSVIEETKIPIAIRVEPRRSVPRTEYKN
jgi:hypothetical protein